MEEQGNAEITSRYANPENQSNNLDDPLDFDSEISEVAEFYNGLNVLVTGGSGFVGKILIEKLLRSCPKIKKLYIVMRAKKDKTPEERFKSYFDGILYDKLKQENPNFLNHVEMIEGDTGASDLGFSVKDREKLKENVNVVFHAAATVRFNETLREVVNINVRGTKLITLFAKEMKNLKVFVHISTAYSYCVRYDLQEKFYEAPIDPEKLFSLIEILDDDKLEHMTEKLIGKWPNTYAFSKAMGEEVVRKYSKGMPSCIIRPSIMVATYKEPLRCWTNNVYGATGIILGAALGVLHTMHCDRKVNADIIPADFVINNIIVAAWHTAKRYNTQKEITDEYEESETNLEPLIYNSVSSCQKPITWREIMTLSEYYGSRTPSPLVIWHYSFILIKNPHLHNLFCILFHTVPGAILDSLSVLTGRKPMLLKAYKKIHKLGAVTSYFATKQWQFNNDNVLALWEEINAVDRERFYFNINYLDWQEFFQYHILGIRLYLLKDPIDTIEAGRQKMRRLRYLHYTVVTLVGLLLFWLVYSIFKFIFF